jgi:hypothetical protein
MKPTEPSGLRATLGDTFTHSDAQRAGISNQRFYRLRDIGEIIALGGGLYRWADAPPADHDLIEIAERVPAAAICLESALARHHLIDAVPAAIDIAVPRGSTRPRLRAPIRIHQFDPRTFELGRELLDTGSRKPVGMYSAERSIIDMIRLRHHEGSDLAWEALRRWLSQPGHSPGRLIEVFSATFSVLLSRMTTSLPRHRENSPPPPPPATTVGLAVEAAGADGVAGSRMPPIVPVHGLPRAAGPLLNMLATGGPSGSALPPTDSRPVLRYE